MKTIAALVLVLSAGGLLQQDTAVRAPDVF
jgi:hypothetical protein